MKPAASGVNADFIIRIGEALYGARWQTELARAVPVSDRTVRRWAAGQTTPDLDDITALIAVAAERAAAVAAALATLQRMAADARTAPLTPRPPAAPSGARSARRSGPCRRPG